jgi:exosortase O
MQVFIITAIIVASTVLYLPVFKWLLEKITLAYGYLHIIALLGLISMALYRLSQLKSNPFQKPRLYHPGIFIWVPATGLYLFNEANVGIYILSSFLLILYLYGLLGHFIGMSLWRSMLLPVLLTVLILPFEHYLDVYLGFPLRLFSAELAGSLLRLSNFPTLTVESILMIENRAAIVDIDCSGINSLWVGAIFYFLLTWIERYRVNFRWFVIGLIFGSLLVLANVVRIVILVALALVIQLPQLAEILHQFLGLLGFIISCLIAWTLLHYYTAPSSLEIPIKNQGSEITTASGLISASVILAIIMGFIVIYQPIPKPIFANIQHTIQLAPRYHAKSQKLSRWERDLFVNNDVQTQKLSFTLPLLDKPLAGSMIFVWNKHWRTHHIPENCYLASGYGILQQGVWVLNRKFAVRFLSLIRQKHSDKKGKVQTGIYWFQSAMNSTTDYSSRVMDGLFNSARDWVMVSILWDRQVSAKEVSAYVDEIKILIDLELNRYE